MSTVQVSRTWTVSVQLLMTIHRRKKKVGMPFLPPGFR